jgi:hypothetical protein
MTLAIDGMALAFQCSMVPVDKAATSRHAPAAQTPISDERRKLLRATLAASPVLLSVASRPVLGQITCAAASAMGSMSPSGGARTAQICSGLTPSQWKSHASSWPSPYCATTMKATGHAATLFHCPTTGLAGRTYGDRTMLEVIDVNESGQGNTSLGRYIVAALLNARAARTPVLSETGVREMWNEVITRGYYEPTAGIRWTANEIVTYLKTTMG